MLEGNVNWILDFDRVALLFNKPNFEGAPRDNHVVPLVEAVPAQDGLDPVQSLGERSLLSGRLS